MDKIDKIILDNIPISVITIDKKGFITSANNYYKKISRIRDYKKHNVFKGEFFKNENLVKEYKKILKNGGVFRKDNCHDINNKGEEIYLDILAVPFRNTKGKIEGVISMASDNTKAITFRNKLAELNESMEADIRERTKELDNANKELIRISKLKSVFIEDVSHEFRTSLAIMHGSLDLMNRSEKVDFELSKNIDSEIHRMITMLTDLTFLTSNDVPVTHSVFKKIDFDELIASVCKGLKAVSENRKIKIEHIVNKSKVKILGNEDELKTLILNLVRNAISYNKNNGWIKVWTEKTKEGVIFHVQDSGIGIPKKEFANIFERFYRIDKARTRNLGDSGLGLAICKNIVETHHGKISVSSKVGEGSTFTVFLPYDFDPDDQMVDKA